MHSTNRLLPFMALWLLLSWGLSSCSSSTMDQLFSRRPEGEIHYDCKPRADDPERLVLRICEYLNENQIWVDRNIGLEVAEIIEQERDGVDVLIVRFDCCGTGDYAVIDKETGKVLSYHLGIY